MSDTDRFKDTVGRFATGVTVVTSVHQDRPVGFTCQSFASLSLEPHMVTVAPQRASTTWPLIRASGRFVVNLLAAHQREESRAFARSGTDKFRGVTWHRSPAGLPIIAESLGWVECVIRNEVDGGDHTVVIAAVTALGAGPSTTPLVFYRGDYLRVPEDSRQQSALTG